MAYEAFKKDQKENPMSGKQGWQQTQKDNTKVTQQTRTRWENRRKSYTGTKKSIINKLYESMAARIMVGKSPHKLEHVKLIYFDGFKKK
jgi:hypothetical protein